MRASVLGLGEWIPEQVRGNDAWPKTFGARDTEGAMRELTDVTSGMSDDLCDRVTQRYVAREAGDPFLGTTRRHVAADTMTAVEAEIRAGRAALDDAGIDGKDVGLVLSWAAVPDRIAPPSAPPVAHALGARSALAMGVDVACASAIAQLAMAAAMIESGRIRYALLTQSHLITRAFPLAYPASPNVGDAATAIVVGATERAGVLATHAVSEGEYYDAVAWRRPRENDSRWFEAGPATFLGSYDANAARALIQNTVRIAAHTVREAAAIARVDVARIGVLASVQPRKWIPAAIAEVLDLPLERAITTFDEHAHLGGCGPIVNLIEARRLGMLTPGTLVAFYAQGTGFTRAAALLEWQPSREATSR